MTAKKLVSKLITPGAALLVSAAIFSSVFFSACNSGEEKPKEEAAPAEVKADSSKPATTDSTTNLNQNAQDTGRGTVSPPPPK